MRIKTDRTKIRKKKELFGVRKKKCRFCVDAARNIDYKDYKGLEYFLKERGKIISGRVSGNCARHQRKLSEEIKKARFMALLPYVRI
jgi:small subunit ribosomal protein S18